MLRLPRPSLATDTDIEREKCFPGEALLGLRPMGSCDPVKLRSSASPAIPDWMDIGLRVVCILSQSEIKKGKRSVNSDSKPDIKKNLEVIVIQSKRVNG